MEGAHQLQATSTNLRKGMCVLTMLYSVRPLLNVSGKRSTGQEKTLKDQLKHDEKTAVKLNERLTVSHPVIVFKSAVQVSVTGRGLHFIPCRTSM